MLLIGVVKCKQLVKRFPHSLSTNIAHMHMYIYLTQTKRWMLGGTTDLLSVIEPACLLQAVPRDSSF